MHSESVLLSNSIYNLQLAFFLISQNSSVIETLPTRLRSAQVSEPWAQECDNQTVQMGGEPHGQAGRGDGTPVGCKLASVLSSAHPETGARQSGGTARGMPVPVGSTGQRTLCSAGGKWQVRCVS